MSTSAPYLSHAIVVIFNSVIFGLGLIASIGLPWFLLVRLSTMIATSRQAPSNEHDPADVRDNSTKAFWDGVLGCLLTFTLVGYVGSSYWFWVKMDSVVGAVLMGTISVVGVSAGIAVSAMIAIQFGRAAGWQI